MCHWAYYAQLYALAGRAASYQPGPPSPQPGECRSHFPHIIYDKIKLLTASPDDNEPHDTLQSLQCVLLGLQEPIKGLSVDCLVTVQCVFISWACAVTAGNAQALSVSSCIRAVLFTGCQSQAASPPPASAEVPELSGTAVPVKWCLVAPQEVIRFCQTALLLIFN